MIGIKNYKALTALVAISAITAVLTGSIHMAFAQLSSTAAQGDVKTITKSTTNTGVNVPTETDQKQNCQTVGGTSPISGSCTAKSNDTITQSGGILNK